MEWLVLAAVLLFVGIAIVAAGSEVPSATLCVCGHAYERHGGTAVCRTFSRTAGPCRCEGFSPARPPRAT